MALKVQVKQLLLSILLPNAKKEAELLHSLMQNTLLIRNMQEI